MLAHIGRILLAPRLRVQRTVRSLRHVVLTQEIRVEEIARLVGSVALIVCVKHVIRCRGPAGGGAFPGVVDARPVLDAEVSAFSD